MPSPTCPHFALHRGTDPPIEVAAPFCCHEHSVVPLKLLRYVTDAAEFLRCGGDMDACQLHPVHRLNVQGRALSGGQP